MPQARAIRAELFLKQGPGKSFPRTFHEGPQTILLNNGHVDELIVRVERVAPRADALSAAQASTLARFRDLFPQEVLAGNQLVSVAHVTLLTTSLADASTLYEMGDLRAFGVVHEHFRLIEEHVRSEAGALVKTVREGVVAVFHDSAAAVRVALDLQPLLTRQEATRDLRLRVAVHAGPAMVATLNGKLDYFGATVNLAMALPDLGDPGDVLISQPLVSHAGVQALLNARQFMCDVLPLSPASVAIHRLMPVASTLSHSLSPLPGILRLPSRTPAG